MGMTALQDSGIRKQQYIDTIKWYLCNTEVNIVVAENTGYDLKPELSEFIRSGRIEYITFNGNNYDKTRGKGYGEAMIIDYGIMQSKLIDDSTLIIKVTGRLKCNSINTIIRKCNKKGTVYSSFTKDGNDQTISNSQVFVFSRPFWENYYYPLISKINDSKGIYFEHVLYDSIKQWKKDGNSFEHFWFPLDLNGVSGTTGKDISTHTSRFIIWIHSMLHLIGYNGSLKFWKKQM